MYSSSAFFYFAELYSARKILLNLGICTGYFTNLEPAPKYWLSKLNCNTDVFPMSRLCSLLFPFLLPHYFFVLSLSLYVILCSCLNLAMPFLRAISFTFQQSVVVWNYVLVIQKNHSHQIDGGGDCQLLTSRKLFNFKFDCFVAKTITLHRKSAKMYDQSRLRLEYYKMQ